MGGLTTDNVNGLTLAISSSFFIGSSFIVKKKGLKKDGGGVRAGAGGYSYLMEPMWWAGMIAMIAGEMSNFAAYAYAPAILVTPLGALSIIFRYDTECPDHCSCRKILQGYDYIIIANVNKSPRGAVLAHFILKEKLHIFGVVGCVLCLVGSTSIVLHAPQDKIIQNVKEVWFLATEPACIVYTCLVLVLVLVLIFVFVPRYGQTNLIVYVEICSLARSLTVISVKAVGIAVKLSFEGMNQFKYFQTWVFIVIVIGFCLLQLNYLNKAPDTFNTAVVSPVYYVMFTTLTILASMIMFKDGDHQNPSQIASEVTGFVTILWGTFLLHKTKDMGGNSTLASPVSTSNGSPDTNSKQLNI